MLRAKDSWVINFSSPNLNHIQTCYFHLQSCKRHSHVWSTPLAFLSSSIITEDQVWYKGKGEKHTQEDPASLVLFSGYRRPIHKPGNGPGLGSFWCRRQNSCQLRTFYLILGYFKSSRLSSKCWWAYELTHTYTLTLMVHSQQVTFLWNLLLHVDNIVWKVPSASHI